MSSGGAGGWHVCSWCGRAAGSEPLGCCAPAARLRFGRPETAKAWLARRWRGEAMIPTEERVTFAWGEYVDSIPGWQPAIEPTANAFTLEAPLTTEQREVVRAYLRTPISDAVLGTTPLTRMDIAKFMKQVKPLPGEPPVDYIGSEVIEEYLRLAEITSRRINPPGSPEATMVPAALFGYVEGSLRRKELTGGAHGVAGRCVRANEKVRARAAPFAYRTVLVPVNITDEHWFLCVVAFGSREVVYYDSQDLKGEWRLQGGGGRGAQWRRVMIAIGIAEWLVGDDTGGKWKLRPAGTSWPAQDGVECGVHTMIAGAAAAAGLVPSSPANSCASFRKVILYRILQQHVPMARSE